MSHQRARPVLCYEQGLSLSPALQAASERVPAGLTGRVLQPACLTRHFSAACHGIARLSDWDHIVGFDPLDLLLLDRVLDPCAATQSGTVPILGGTTGREEIVTGRHVVLCCVVYLKAW